MQEKGSAMNRKNLVGALLATAVLLGSVPVAGRLADARGQMSGMSVPGPAAASAQNLVPVAGDHAQPSDAVREAQEQLRGAGFDPGRVTGVVHSQTQEAIRKYQRVKGLPVTGELDDRTRGALRRERIVT
jgi:hypothetical protein